MRSLYRLLSVMALAFPPQAWASPTPAPAPARAAGCADDAGWNDPAAPVQVYANTWYVGTCGLSAILITSAQGHVLIDGATEAAAPLILANIRRLGFRPEQVRYLLNSHEHADHAGGLAALQRATGAAMVARAPAATALERGRSGRSDPQFRILDPFEPVTQVRRIGAGERLLLGSLALTAHATPGHAPGGTSWSWQSCHAGQCLDLVYADSLTAISDDQYRYTDEQAHPGALAAFRRSLETVSALPCDLLLTPHPQASQLWQRLGPQARTAPTDRGTCRDYAARARDVLEQRLAKEAASAP